MIKIYCGYQSMGDEGFPIFEGEIAYMSPKNFSCCILYPHDVFIL